MFENPLPNARFDADYQQINTSWRKNLSMSPLFVSSQEEELSMDDIEHKIRATLKSLDFSQTQPGAVSLLYSFNPTDEVLNNYSDLIQDQVRDAPPTNSSQMKSLEAYSQLGKRFVKSTKNKTSNYFVRQQERLQKRLRKYQSYKKEANEKKVELYRNYRLGELPDIQIGYMDIIKPLEKLACSDYNISRMIYCNLVVSIVKNSLEETRSEDLEFQDEVIDAIKMNLTNSTQCFTPTIASFLRICFDLNATKFDSALIKKVSTKSNNHHIGIAFLENQLLKHDADDEDDNRSKRIRVSEGGHLRHEKKKWIDLSLLFKEIDEPEIFQGTYQNYVASNNLSKNAIAAEVGMEYARAYNLFKEAKDTLLAKTDPKETSLWDEEMLRCFEQLTQWDDIAIQVGKALPNTDYDKLWEPGYKDFYLNYFMKSFTRLRQGISLSANELEGWTSDNANPIFKFIREALNSTSKKNYLIEHFPCEVSITEMRQKNYNSGRYIIRNSYDSHLNEWATIHPLAHTSRLKKLIELQRMVEVEDYFEFLADIKSSPDNLYKTKQFFSLLCHRYPNTHVDSMSIWDDIIDTRLLFIEDLKDNISQGSAANIATITRQAKKEFLEKMAEAAYNQSIDNVAIKYLLKLRDMDQNDVYRFGLLQQRYVQSAKMAKDNPKRNKAIATTLVKCLEHKIPENFPVDKTFNNRLLMSKIYRFIFNEIQDDPNIFRDLARSGSVKNSINNDPSLLSIYKFADFLEESGYQQFNKIEEKLTKEDEIYTKCLWEFGRYCDDMLRFIQDSPNKLHPQINQKHYSEIVVKNYLKAMDRGSKIAAERFPRLLELIEMYPESGEIFKEYSNSFNGTWMYIQWIPQLVAVLDTLIAQFVFPSIKRLAEAYPNALYYPFHISFEHYEIIKDKLDAKNVENIEQINAMLRSPLKEEFLLELRRLTDPEHILKDFIDFIQSVVSSQDTPKSFVVNAFDQISQLLLNPYNTRLGIIPKAFAIKYATELREMMGKNGSKLANLSSKDITKILNYCESSTQKTSSGSKTGANLLKSYSPWLAKFKIGDHVEDLEIPGQYDGLNIPYPEYHAKIARFDGSVLVMTSMRKPKRVRIYGTDEKEYKFLVKGGEDLRLDQRIQQLFTVMNNVISKNGYCARQEVNIVTYTVVPMASNIGIIEWVDDTKPLRACIEEEVNSKMLFNRMQGLYRAWISKCAPGTKRFTESYQKAFAESRENVTKHMEDTTSYIESTVMRNYLMRLASSPEAFLFIRKGFAHSLATISIFGYILGIGDRHLENFLLDLKSGRLIPIDFGHAFGSATELLPIPELVPFRLTRQLVGALEPLGISGALEHVMVYILQAIRDDKEILINTMDVFVKEPLLDWKKSAIKQAKSQNKVSGSESDDMDGSYGHEVKWYPQKKMDIARRKLDGDNPSEILITELMNGHQNQSYIESLKEIAKGHPNINYRAKVGKKCSNVQEQVKCLIDLATDPLALGVAWVGWQSYI
ncbi:hypothetical protein K501DRAFT_333495 [Backusella circina FSU 941]|nr:hypothetical protein K501DRAFT_333495 [Backusella circina FSU 941]